MAAARLLADPDTGTAGFRQISGDDDYVGRGFHSGTARKARAMNIFVSGTRSQDNPTAQTRRSVGCQICIATLSGVTGTNSDRFGAERYP